MELKIFQEKRYKLEISILIKRFFLLFHKFYLQIFNFFVNLCSLHCEFASGEKRSDLN